MIRARKNLFTHQKFAMLGRGRSLLASCLLGSMLSLSSANAYAAGTLAAAGSSDLPIQIRNHHVEMVINNGFAQVDVTQTFYNPNPQNLEATYSFPVPKSASLSQFTITAGEQEIKGEVVAKDQAHQIYEEEKNNGNQTGVADRNSYQDFQFKIASVPAQKETKVHFMYYQPLQIDSGIGRLVYPLEDGGTDDAAKNFWTANTKVEDTFSARIRLRMSVPIEEVRLPGFENATEVEKAEADDKIITLNAKDVSLNKDLIVYYRLASDLPGRIEMLPYKKTAADTGSFMMVVTPGEDLKPLTQGADYTFVLDVSGSMTDKLSTLAKGVSKALGTLRPQDRFRLISFSDSASDLSGWDSATPENVQAALQLVQNLSPQGGTNLYEGMELALKDLDADRVSSVVLVTDGVTNEGIIDPKEFKNLIKTKDIRFFGFLMGNGSNWPLLDLIAHESGGFYRGVSNADDIVGQLMLAKAKLTSEALHNVDFKISGVKVTNTTEAAVKKIYLGDQMVVFGQYEGSGPATITLKAGLSGEDKTYSTTVNFPEVDVEYPEIERLWAMNQVEALERKALLGELADGEKSSAIKSIGINYQIVTDETSMLVLSDDLFAKHGVDRKNQNRIALEQNAQTVRYSQAVRNTTVDTSNPAFGANRSYHVSRGGGALDPKTMLVGICFLSVLILAVMKTKKEY